MSTEGTSKDFPASWTNSLIGDVAEFVRGVTYQKSDARNQAEEGYIPLIRATNIGNESITYDEFVFVPRNVVKSEQLIRVNDMVIAASSGSISVVGKSAPVVKDFEATFGAFCAVLRPKNEVLPGFFRLFVQSPTVRETWSNLARGTNINNLKREQVLSTGMPIAPLLEQQKIVEILDEQLPRLDAALASVRAVREKSARFRRSLLHAAFTGVLTGHDISTRAVPKDWEEVEVGSLGQWVTGSTPSSKKPGSFGDSYPFVTPGDINAWGRLTQTIRGLSEIGWAEVRAVKPPSVLLVCIGTIGKVAWTELAVATNQQINALSVDTSKYEHRFLSLMFSSASFQELLWDNSSSTTVSIINKGTLSRIVVPVPPLEEQKRIVEILEVHISKLEAGLSVADAIEKKASALRRSLLHAAFNGNLTKEWRESAHV
jgi:type I restriction enzyme S subunit